MSSKTMTQFAILLSSAIAFSATVQSEMLELNSTSGVTVSSVAVVTTNVESGTSAEANLSIATAPAESTAPDPADPMTSATAQQVDVPLAPDTCIADLKITTSTGEQSTMSNVDVCGMAGLIVEEVAENAVIFVAPPGEEEGVTEPTPIE